MIRDIDQAFVLQSYETGNTSGVLRLFSAETGGLSILAKGLLRKGKEDIKTSLQAGNFVRLSISLRDGAEMGTLREVSTISELPHRRKSLFQFSFLCLILDLVYRGIDPGKQSQKAMSLLVHHFVDGEAEPAQKNDISDEDLALFVELSGLLGLIPDFAEEVSKPWPEGKTKPQFFMLDLDQGRLFIPEESHQNLKWPSIATAKTGFVPVPPSGMRFLYNFEKGQPASVSDPAERLQLIIALCRLVEWHDDVQLPSFRFWLDFIKNRK